MQATNRRARSVEPRRSALSLLGGLVLASLPSLACEQNPKTNVETLRVTAAANASNAPREPNERGPELIGTPKEVLQANGSAYSARLAFDGQDALLLTDSTLYRVHPDGQLETRSVSLGIRPVVTDTFLFFWRSGWFYKTDKHGQAQARWFQEPNEPVWAQASHDAPVWVVAGAEGGHSLRTRTGPKSTTLYETASKIVTLSSLGGRAFFVEASRDGSWRFVSVALDPKDAPPAFSPPHAGRPPALLMPAENELIYYAGLSGGVRALSPDLRNDRTIKDDWICSPLSVAQSYAFCASVDGIGAASLTDGPTSWKKAILPGPIAQIAASAEQIAWLIDRGENRFSLELAPTMLQRGR